MTELWQRLSTVHVLGLCCACDFYPHIYLLLYTYSSTPCPLSCCYQTGTMFASISPLATLYYLLIFIRPLYSSSSVQQSSWHDSRQFLGANSTYSSNSPANCSFWLENVAHRGVAPFADKSSYQVFRNVKEYGATGDGATDDTAAINRAIRDGNRCAPGSCASSTTTPALVYFPAGTYLVSHDIVDYYYTTLYGNPNCLPIIKVSSNYTGTYVIDGDPYSADNRTSYNPTAWFVTPPEDIFSPTVTFLNDIC